MSLERKSEKGEKAEMGRGTSSQSESLPRDFRISSRRVVYWFCLAWISGESSNLVDAENGNGMPELAIPGVGCRARLKGVTIRDVELFRSGLGRCVLRGETAENS